MGGYECRLTRRSTRTPTDWDSPVPGSPVTLLKAARSARDMDTLRVEDFQPRDTDALVPMWRASFEHGVGVIDRHPLEEQVEYLRSKVLPVNRARVAKEGESIVGFLASNPESVAQLYVRVQHNGQGIGTRLLRLAQSESSGSLWLFTFARNSRACRFYVSVMRRPH